MDPSLLEREAVLCERLFECLIQRFSITLQGSGIASYGDTTLLEQSRTMQYIQKKQTTENQWFVSHLKQR